MYIHHDQRETLSVKKSTKLHFSKEAWSNPTAMLWFQIVATVSFTCSCFLDGVDITQQLSSDISMRTNFRISLSAGGKPQDPSSRGMKLIIGQVVPNISASLDLPKPLLWANTSALE